MSKIALQACRCESCQRVGPAARTEADAENLADLQGWAVALGVAVCPRCKHTADLPDIRVTLADHPRPPRRPTPAAC